MEIRALFALNVRRLRRRSGLSQEDLAYAAGVNRSYFSKIETGKTYAGLEIIEKLSLALNANPTDFFQVPSKKSTPRK
jgi:transcriptional regulator with XRE-family HTH domain